jgi:cullin 1
MAAAIDFSTSPSKQADLVETWTYLNAGVDHIMNTLEKGLSFAGYTNLYTTVYNFCTSTKMNGKIDGNRCESLWANSFNL